MRDRPSRHWSCNEIPCWQHCRIRRRQRCKSGAGIAVKTIEVPLHAVAHARAGDKGNRSNISVIPYRARAFDQLRDQLTEQRVLAVFAHRGATGVTRYVLPRLPAMNFVIENALEGGVNGSLGLDGHGKSLSFLLLGDITVRVTRDCLPEHSPYDNAHDI